MVLTEQDPDLLYSICNLVDILDAHSNNVICPVIQHTENEYRSPAPWHGF